jgi:hypothetical protein
LFSQSPLATTGQAGFARLADVGCNPRGARASSCGGRFALKPR